MNPHFIIDVRLYAPALSSRERPAMGSALLFEYEMKYLLQALRRDLRTELKNAQLDKSHAKFHLQNSRATLHLLEAFNPTALKVIL